MILKRRTVTWIIFASLAIVFLLLLTPKILQLRSLRARSRALESEIQQLKIQNQIMENELRLLREDPVYLEKVARQKLNKAKQGEIVYKVVRELPPEKNG